MRVNIYLPFSPPHFKGDEEREGMGPRSRVKGGRIRRGEGWEGSREIVGGGEERGDCNLNYN